MLCNITRASKNKFLSQSIDRFQIWNHVKKKSNFSHIYIYETGKNFLSQSLVDDMDALIISSLNPAHEYALILY